MDLASIFLTIECPSRPLRARACDDRDLRSSPRCRSGRPNAASRMAAGFTPAKQIFTLTPKTSSSADCDSARVRVEHTVRAHSADDPDAESVQVARVVSMTTGFNATVSTPQCLHHGGAAGLRRPIPVKLMKRNGFTTAEASSSGREPSGRPGTSWTCTRIGRPACGGFRARPRFFRWSSGGGRGVTNTHLGAWAREEGRKLP